MRKQIRAGLHKELGFLALFLLFIAGCTTIYKPGMSEWDYKAMSEGRNLHCTEVIVDRCITHQWVNGTTNTYKRFKYGTSLVGTNSSDN